MLWVEQSIAMGNGGEGGGRGQSSFKLRWLMCHTPYFPKDPVHPVLSTSLLPVLACQIWFSRASKEIPFYVIEQFLPHKLCHVLEESKGACPGVLLTPFLFSPIALQWRISCGESRASSSPSQAAPPLIELPPFLTEAPISVS